MITSASTYQSHNAAKENRGRVEAPNLIFIQALSGTQLQCKEEFTLKVTIVTSKWQITFLWIKRSYNYKYSEFPFWIFCLSIIPEK